MDDYALEDIRRDASTAILYEDDLFTTEDPGSSGSGRPLFYDLFGKIYYPCVVIIGITGNIFNLVILSNKSMGKYSSTIYLLGLACADILVLTFQTTLKYVVYKSWQVTEPREFNVFLCVYNNWILIGAVRTSFWITVGFTIERYIAIAHPLFGKTWCTVSRAKKSLCVIYLCGFAYGTYNLAVRKVTEDNVCVFKGGVVLKAAMGRLNAASFVVTYALLALFNGLMIFNITRQSQRMKASIAKSVVKHISNNGAGETGNRTKSTKGHGSSQRHVTLTLLTVSFVFMVLWCPWLLVYLNAQLPNNMHGLPHADTLALCAEVMGPLNSAVNFFLYNLTSRRFRREFMRIICAGRRTPEVTKGSISVSTSHASLSAMDSEGSVRVPQAGGNANNGNDYNCNGNNGNVGTSDNVNGNIGNGNNGIGNSGKGISGLSPESFQIDGLYNESAT